MTGSEGFGERLSARWVDWYTRHLPADVASQRRDEIASDRWEHAADRRPARGSDLHFELEVAGRVLAGVPADLTWRRDVLRSHPSITKGSPIMHRLSALTRGRDWTTLLAVLGAGFLVVVGAALIVTGTDEHTAAGRIYGAVGLAGGLAMSAGIHGLRTGRLRLSVARSLLVAGAVILGVGFWWFLLLPAIVAVVVVYFGVVRRRLEGDLQVS